jgi:hypothetical protein
MTAAKKNDPVDQAAADTAELEAKVAEIEDKGYIGSVPDPLPNSAHSLASGPDAPPLVPDNRTRFEQPAARREES